MLFYLLVKIRISFQKVNGGYVIWIRHWKSCGFYRVRVQIKVFVTWITVWRCLGVNWGLVSWILGINEPNLPFYNVNSFERIKIYVLVTSSLKGTLTACGMMTVSADADEQELVEYGSKWCFKLLAGVEGFKACDDMLSWRESFENGFLGISRTSGVVGRGSCVPSGMLMFSGGFRLWEEETTLLLFLQKSLSRIWYHIS